MSVSIQHIFLQNFERFASTRRLSKDMWHAANMLCGCRTAALGGHIVSCPNGHQHRIAYNSCRHRSCPQCALLPREKWLHGWRTRLLDCPHYHVVFTTPHELNSLWRYNRKGFAEALFAAATGALTQLLADEKYLGARPGLLAALHTWSQTLAAHVHLHVLVTAGGLDTSGRWRKVVKPCLLPRKVLMIIFRGKLRAELLDALDRGELQLPPDMSQTQARGLLNKLGRTVWNVKILDRYDHGVGVVTYLARYLKGGPISPTRFISVTPDRVRFRCRSTTGEGGSGGGDVRLKMDDFLCRLLNHVPPRSMQTIRGYGLYAGCKRELLNDARECLGQARLPSEPPAAPTWQDVCIALGLGSKAKCEQCGEELVVHGHFKRGRAPPSCQLRESIGL